LILPARSGDGSYGGVIASRFLDVAVNDTILLRQLQLIVRITCCLSGDLLVTNERFV